MKQRPAQIKKRLHYKYYDCLRSGGRLFNYQSHWWFNCV